MGDGYTVANGNGRTHDTRLSSWIFGFCTLISLTLRFFDFGTYFRWPMASMFVL